ncbi:hypothetical protein Dimus_030224, partial [Dionaea muscipula]
PTCNSALSSSCSSQFSPPSAFATCSNRLKPSRRPTQFLQQHSKATGAAKPIHHQA